MEAKSVIEIKNVTKTYRLYNDKKDHMVDMLLPFLRRTKYKQFNAVNNVSLKVKKGEVLGIVGRNGSGKSTLLKMISGVTTPTTGKISVKGNIVPLLELGGGFNKDLTGIENIYYYAMLLGYPKSEIFKIIAKVEEFAEIGEFINQPISTYSSGMRSRLAFSTSINIKPEILIVDEVLSVGDEYFKKKSLAKMLELFNSGITIIFVSHSAKDIKELCNRVILMHQGNLIADGKPDEILKLYQEKYKK